jgi:hypothetical protein
MEAHNRKFIFFIVNIEYQVYFWRQYAIVCLNLIFIDQNPSNYLSNTFSESRKNIKDPVFFIFAFRI